MDEPSLPRPFQILIVDDDEDDALLTEELIREGTKGMTVTLDHAFSFSGALERIDHTRYDFFLLDYRLGKEDGLALLRAIRARGVTCPVMILTGWGDEEIAVEAMKAGAMEYLAKSKLSSDVLRTVIHHAVEWHEQEERRQQAEEALRVSEEQLRQSQKLEAVGQLAGGIAHDFNNLLTVIRGYSDLMLVSLDRADPQRVHLEAIKDAADRAASLTRQLLAFSRKQVLQPKVLDLNALVTNVNQMLQRMIGEDIDLAIVLRSDLGHVKADPGQLEQVIMNLVVNARDAMPQGGQLTIETANVELDEAYARRHAAVQPGPYVMLTVSDTGHGMDAKTQARIFEPFFTTKGPGQGTGLGLSTVYGIVKQSGGSVWVYSEPGHGTTFRIYLQRVQEQVEAPQAPSPGASPHETETVLLAEDDKTVRTLVRMVLQEHGYTVLAAPHGVEALRISEAHQGVIHLLVTDVVMPGMNGRELAQRLALARPDMKVLYVSGYTDDVIIRHGVLEAGIAFLQKPFTPDVLARKVRDVLDAGKQEGTS